MQEKFRSDINRDVRPATEGEFRPLEFGQLSVWPPVILAPMAGVTNYPFRSLCKEFGAGLYVSEMITARPLVERHNKTMKLSDFGDEESPRSLQLYGVDPYYLAEAAKFLVSEGRVDHIDMNFGCPVKKITSKGGGSAIPIKPNLLRRLVRAVVENAGDIPVTIKVRVGVNDDLISFPDAGRIAEEEGCAAIALHARTAAQLYSGTANWDRIGELKSLVNIPVLGNGDIWEAEDALRMMRQTGCDGVVVGRGCLGRPWLFRDLNDVFHGREPQDPPTMGEVANIMYGHAVKVCDWFGEVHGVRMMRKFATWYMKGFRRSARLRNELIRVETLEQMSTILATVDQEEEFPAAAMRVTRGKGGSPQHVTLPDGYLDDLQDDTPPSGAAGDLVSGG